KNRFHIRQANCGMEAMEIVMALPLEARDMEVVMDMTKEEIMVWVMEVKEVLNQAMAMEILVDMEHMTMVMGVVEELVVGME
ncbi:hypothetical protein, partial [Escherichia marmotae]|uniref:hypothetical protein n=1 Tax=Escherichia marmotae TaxID=1499973 RepID=UPI0020006C75